MVKSLMEKSKNKIANGRIAHVCKMCGKEGPGMDIKDHIESNHLEGMAFQYNICGQNSRTRHVLKVHLSIVTKSFLLLAKVFL